MTEEANDRAQLAAAIEALREDSARREKELAALADRLVPPAAEPQQPGPAKSAEERQNEEFLNDLMAAADSGWKSTPGLLGR